MKPSGERWLIKNTENISHFTAWLNEIVDAGKKVTLQVLNDPRTNKQNAMFYALYRDIAGQLEDKTLIEVKAECKLRYGVVIRKAADPKFSALYDKAIKPMALEDKLLVMQEFPITSDFTKAQGSDYIDSILNDYTRMGYALADPRLEAEYTR